MRRAHPSKLLVLLMVGAARLALADETTCPNDVVQGDADLWAVRRYMTETWYRDMVADFYNLQKGDWDEGWGWAKYNDPDPWQYEFCKMMSVGSLLWAGIEDTVSRQGPWSARYQVEPGGTYGYGYPRLRAVSRAPEVVDLLYRDAASGRLRHLAIDGSPWHAGALPSVQIGTWVSDRLATPKVDYRIDGPPDFVVRSPEAIDAVARRGNELLHFSWTTTAGWTATLPTQATARPTPFGGSDRYFIAGDPVALAPAPDRLEVVALDDFRHLISYRWTSAAGWTAQDATLAAGDGPHINRAVVPVARPDGSLDVLGLDVAGQLIHYRRTGESWAARNVTPPASSNAVIVPIDSQPAVVLRDDGTLHVFARRGGYRLFHFVQDQAGTWAEEDLNRAISPRFALDGAVSAQPRGTEALDVVARDINGQLVHYFWEPQPGWRVESLNEACRWGALAGDPVLLPGGRDRLDIFGRSLAGHLQHCGWTPETWWFSGEPGRSQTQLPEASTFIGSDPVVVRRGPSALEIFVGQLFASDPSLPARGLLQFSAAVGPVVNPWHTNSEYSDWASGSTHGFKIEPGLQHSEVSVADAAAFRGFWQTDRVEMYCGSFGQGNSPALRAAILLHEATHMNFWDFPHSDNPPGTNCPVPCSDPWLFHALGDPAGTLDDGILESNVGHVIVTDHSMTQVEIEYLCDVTEFPRADLPLSVYAGARDVANYLMYTRILQPPGWVCGEPRPLP